MSALHLGKIAWAIASAGLAFVLNTHLKPGFERSYAAAEYGTATGKLSLGGVTGELPIMTLHIVTADVEHLGRKFKIRELLVRGASEVDATAALELYVRLPEAPGDDLSTGAHNAAMFRELDLPVVPVGRLGKQPSYVFLDGKRTAVVLGTLTLTDLVPPDGNAGAYQVQGRVELQVESAHGIDLVSGRLSGQLVWDPNPAAPSSSR